MVSVQDALKEELAALEEDELNERLMGADHVPVHNPAGSSSLEERESCHASYTCCQHMNPYYDSSGPRSGRRRRGCTAKGATSSFGHELRTPVFPSFFFPLCYILPSTG